MSAVCLSCSLILLVIFYFLVHFLKFEINYIILGCNNLGDPDIEWFDAKHLQFGCIGFVKIEMRPPEAEKYCMSRGYRLVEIYNQNQQDFIAEKCTEIAGTGPREHFWIGLKRINGTSTWKWLDSDVIPEFTAWDTSQGQPSNAIGGDLLAIAYSRLGYKWADFNNDSIFKNNEGKPICQKL